MLKKPQTDSVLSISVFFFRYKLSTSYIFSDAALTKESSKLASRPKQLFQSIKKNCAISHATPSSCFSVRRFFRQFQVEPNEKNKEK